MRKMIKMMKSSLIGVSFLIGMSQAGLASIQQTSATGNGAATEKYFDSIKDKPIFLRQFLRNFPKGGDIHNHLVGAIYSENYIKWAAEDGLCIHPDTYAIVPPEKGKSCAVSAVRATYSGEIRDNVINALSMRSFVASSNWAGHDQFFSTFNKMFYASVYQYGDGPLRTGDMLAEVTARAAGQNLGYLELLHTMELGTILSVVPSDFGEGTESLDELYQALMSGPFGKKLPDMVSSARAHLDYASQRKESLLRCPEDGKAPGCEVKTLFLHQVIREFSLPQVFAQLILGAELVKSDSRMVGLNMVAPEHGANAMSDYDSHMKMIDLLWTKEKEAGRELNVTLHAGELTLGLVEPEGLENHIRKAIEVAHAKRIGHGIDIAYENDSINLLRDMADKQIMVEVNLTSNDVILGVKGRDHPYALYKKAGVPMALSTDDEGVSRINLTHEYLRAVLEQNVSYQDLKTLSRNSLVYSFLPGKSLLESGNVSHAACAADLESSAIAPSDDCSLFLRSSDKASLQWKLEHNIMAFEKEIASLMVK